MPNTPAPKNSVLDGRAQSKNAETKKENTMSNDKILEALAAINAKVDAATSRLDRNAAQGSDIPRAFGAVPIYNKNAKVMLEVAASQDNPVVAALIELGAIFEERMTPQFWDYFNRQKPEKAQERKARGTVNDEFSEIGKAIAAAMQQRA